MPPLTKEQLDRETREWREDLASRGHDVDAPADCKGSLQTTKAVPTVHNAELIKAIARGFAPTIHALEKQIAKLEQRIEELESSGLKYCGTHQCSMDYRKGHATTYEGALWVATRDVSAERPGHGDGWQLAVKSGRDAATMNPRSDATSAAARVNGHYSQPRS